MNLEIWPILSDFVDSKLREKKERTKVNILKNFKQRANEVVWRKE